MQGQTAVESGRFFCHMGTRDVKIVGLTGGIATGKSTVATMLRELGAEVIDADEIAREIVRPGQEAWHEIVDYFGAAILRQDRSIDREKLRKIVFKDAAARKKLDSITHPRIRLLADQKMQALAAKGVDLVVYEAPLFFENKTHLRVRPVIVVSCDPKVQVERLRNRDRLTDEEIRLHLEAQMPLSQKAKLADYVIENGGDLQGLKAQVQRVWDKIRST